MQGAQSRPIVQAFSNPIQQSQLHWFTTISFKIKLILSQKYHSRDYKYYIYLSQSLDVEVDSWWSYYESYFHYGTQALSNPYFLSLTLQLLHSSSSLKSSESVNYSTKRLPHFINNQISKVQNSPNIKIKCRFTHWMIFYVLPRSLQWSGLIIYPFEAHLGKCQGSHQPQCWNSQVFMTKFKSKYKHQFQVQDFKI